MHPFYGPSSQFLGGGNYWWLGMASMLLYLLFWAVVIVFAAKLFKKYYPGTERPKTREDTALSILRERYARGEIDAEEFKQKKSDLE
jgi:putative membrane protein